MFFDIKYRLRLLARTKIIERLTCRRQVIITLGANDTSRRAEAEPRTKNNFFSDNQHDRNVDRDWASRIKHY